MLPGDSPLLDRYNQTGIVEPALQRVIENVRAKLGSQFQVPGLPGGGEQSPTIAPPAKPMPSLDGAPPAAAPGLIGGQQPAELPAAGSAPAAPAQPVAPSPHEAELARLTAPPLPSGDPRAHTKEDTGLSGIGQIHNPWARIPLQVLNGIGSAFAPRLMEAVPGTGYHHRGLIESAQENVKEDEELKGNEATRQNMAAKTAELGQRGQEEAARTDALKNPEPKQEMEGKTLETDQGIFQWNTATKRYDIKAGNSKTPKEAGTVHELEDGTLVVAHPDGTATALTMNGSPVKGKGPAEPKKTPEEIAIEEYRSAHPSATEQEAREKTKIVAPERPPHVLMMDPTTRILQEAGPGSRIPEGAVTPGTESGENAGAVKAAAAAAKAKEDATHEYTLAQALSANPSPTNDLALVMRYIGATKPDSLGKLRLNNNEINLVYGTRSALGSLEALVSKLQNGQSLTPKQRQDMVDTMKVLAGGGEGPKTYGIPVDKAAAFEKDHPGAQKGAESGGNITYTVK